MALIKYDMRHPLRIFSALCVAAALPFFFVAGAAAQEAGAQADAPPPSKVERFGTWATRCQPNPETKKDTCHAFVDVRIDAAGDDSQKARVLYLGIGYVPDGSSMFTLAVAPLGALLPKGLVFKIDETKEFGGPFAFCMPSGCQADLLLDEAKLKQLRGGSKLKVTYTDIRRGLIEIPIGLDGISAALDSLPKP